MKKIMIFLMTILGINILSTMNVSAQEYTFYEGEYIDGIYMNKEKGGTIYYQKARFFRRSSDNQFSYCIEPFSFFTDGSIYNESINADNLSNEQMKRIKDIVHFGYGYKNHTDPSWYAVTQFMLWQVSDPTGNYYFTDSLNGNRISRFDSEINEINSLINDYYNIPSINNTTIDLNEGESFTLTETNNVLSKYTSTNDFVHIDGNNLKIDSLKEGNYNVKLVRNDNYNGHIPLFYNSSTSQNMAMVGDLDEIGINININVVKTEIELTKIDSDNNNTIPKGEANLIGAKYQLFDSLKNKIDTLTIGNNNKAIYENLKYGRYYIKEIEAGEGYNIDDNFYTIEISKDTPKVKLNLKNKVIEKEIELHKLYGEDNNFNNEKNISFDIFDSKDKLVSTITTDDNGIAKIILPYGKYTFKQLNSTDGYTSIDDFEVKVVENGSEYKELYDYLIKKDKKKTYDYIVKVPNTYNRNSNNNYIVFILLTITGLIYVKKTIFS